MTQDGDQVVTAEGRSSRAKTAVDTTKVQRDYSGDQFKSADDCRVDNCKKDVDSVSNF